MAGQKRRQMGFHSNGTHPWSTAAVWNAESFVQIKMGNIAPVIAGAAKSNLGVEIGSVQINLTTLKLCVKN